MEFHKKRLLLLLFTCLFFIQSCSVFKSAVYDQHSYERAIEFKVEALDLMDKATKPYNDHSSEVGNLYLDTKKILEYEKNRDNNGITLAMWEFLTDKSKNSFSGFMLKWEKDNDGVLDEVFINEAKGLVTQAMDLLIAYELKKNSVTSKSLSEFILSN